MRKNALPTHTLIVRLWQENSEVPKDAWRGSIEHVKSGRRLYFQGLAEMELKIAALAERIIAMEFQNEEEFNNDP